MIQFLQTPRHRNVDGASALQLVLPRDPPRFGRGTRVDERRTAVAAPVAPMATCRPQAPTRRDRRATELASGSRGLLVRPESGAWPARLIAAMPRFVEKRDLTGRWRRRPPPVCPCSGPASLLLGESLEPTQRRAERYLISESAGQMSSLLGALELDDSLDADTLELLGEGDWQDELLDDRAAVATVTLACQPNKRAKTDSEGSCEDQAATTPRKPTKKRPRNKEKIQELRLEVAQLEAQVSELQYRKGYSRGASSEDWKAVKLEALLWRDAAAGLHKQRRQAEASNAMLKKLLAAQVEFSTSLAQIADLWEASALDA
jgi:hypothetical protein